MTVSGINLNYAVASNQKEQVYPALQVTNYQPRSLSEPIDFCMSETSCDLLNHDTDLFKTEVVECVYGREAQFMFKIVSDVRWIFLNIPRMFAMDKTSKKVSYPERGVKFIDSNKITVARCFLACVYDGNLIIDKDGKPQIFTLKLTSSKTNLIGYWKSKSETKTIMSLNKALQKHYKINGNLIHLASVNLVAKPQEFVSSITGASSLGVMYQLEGDAKALREEHQKQIFELITDDKVKAIFDDPFGLKESQVNNSQPAVDEEDEIDL